jgi:hypothetical protein
MTSQLRVLVEQPTRGKRWVAVAADWLHLVATAGQPSTAAGWGTTSENGSTSRDLQKVTMPVVSDSSCAASYGLVAAQTALMLCAGQPQGGVPESTSARSQPGAPTYGPAPTSANRAPIQDGGVPLFGVADAPPFARQSSGPAPDMSPFGAAGQAPTGTQPAQDVSLFGAPGGAGAHRDASPYGLAGTGQATTSAHHQPVQDTSAFGRGPDGDLPLFGVAGVRQTTSAHHEPVQDASAYDGPRYGGGSTERGQDAGAGRAPTGANRAPAQDGVPLFGAPPTSQPGRNGAPGYGLFGAGAPGPAPTGAHRAPSETDAASNGRTGPTAGRGAPNAGGDAAAPSYGTNGATAGGADDAATRSVNGAPRDSAVPSQRAGTEASGPSYQQAGGARRRDGASPSFGPTGPGPSGAETAQPPPYGRSVSAGRELPTRGRRSAEQRPADQGGGDADPSPETTAFPVQQAPTANPAPSWGRPPPPGQDDTMVAGPGWLGAAQPGSDAAGPPGPRRAARDRRHGNAGEARHGQPDPERPDATQVFPQPER